MLTLPTFSEMQFRALRDPSKADPDAGFGTLSTTKGALPLAALAVQARLDGLIAGVEVCQTFINAHDEPLEATYIFPLPDRAAVTSFRLEVAGRVVEGELQERTKARQQYDEAIMGGHRAAIAEEERAGVFTMRVGNLPPGERAVVKLTLVGPLPYSDGEVTFRFPLVVAPRYIPGKPLPGEPTGSGVSADTDAVPDASRISPPVLLPGFPNPVQLRLEVEVAESSLAPHDFISSLHTVLEEQRENVLRFRILPGERLDRDFVLRYRLGSDRVHTALTVQPDAGGSDEGTFLLTVVPPTVKGSQAQRPRDVVFVLDRSGSMSGWKMVAARRAVARMVETLTEHDRFTVYAFDDSIETPGGFDGIALVPASDRQRFRAAEFLAGIDARGGTEMADPLDKAMQELLRGTQSGEADRILVLITDGQVGNEDAILRKLGQRGTGVRIFTLGIDRAVNAAFLRRLADLGGGSSEVVESEERLDAVMDQVHRHIGTPVLTGLAIMGAGLDLVASSLVPGRLPDLFAGAPLLISGRYRGGHQGAAVRLRARDAGNESWSTEVRAYKDAEAPLSKVWARGRVRELEDRYAIDRGDKAKLEHEIVETSLRFGVLSRFTAFVAVDRAAVVNPGGAVKQVTQAVEQPSGWGRNATVGSRVSASAPPNAAGAGGAMRASRDAAKARSFASHREMGNAPLASRSAPASPRPPASPPPPAADKSDSEFGVVGACLGADFDDDLDDADEDDRTRASGGPATLAQVDRPGASDKGGVLQRLLGLFGLGKQAKSPPPALDREQFRNRVSTLLQRLQTNAADTQSRRALLQATATELEALFRDLVAAGDLHESVERRGKQLVTLPTLLLEASPAASAIDQHYLNIVCALRDWLALLAPAGGGGSSKRREGFWK
jgi:Ca-activated chloride channel family protein